MKIVNCRYYWDHREGITYCGRTWMGWEGSPLGNPFSIIKDGTRQQILKMYARWLWDKIKARDPTVMQALLSLKDDSVLGCWCIPEREGKDESEMVKGSPHCHCEIIIRAYRYLKAQGL